MDQGDGWCWDYVALHCIALHCFTLSSRRSECGLIRLTHAGWLAVSCEHEGVVAYVPWGCRAGLAGGTCGATTVSARLNAAAKSDVRGGCNKSGPIT